MTQEGQESFIGVFVVPEIIPEHVAPSEPLRANQDAAMGIVVVGIAVRFPNTASDRPNQGK
jgi:hypothetical protein